MSAVADSESTLARRSIDVLLELYVAWREQCATVRRAYQSWGRSARNDRALAYAGYVAELDREEQAARAYADQIELVGRLCA